MQVYEGVFFQVQEVILEKSNEETTYVTKKKKKN